MTVVHDCRHDCACTMCSCNFYLDAVFCNLCNASLIAWHASAEVNGGSLKNGGDRKDRKRMTRMAHLGVRAFTSNLRKRQGLYIVFLAHADTKKWMRIWAILFVVGFPNQMESLWWGRSAKSRQSARVAIPQPKRGQRVLPASELSMSLGGISIGMLTSPLYISYYDTGCHLHMCVVCESEWQATQESCRKDVGECGAVERPHKLLSIIRSWVRFPAVALK